MKAGKVTGLLLLSLFAAVFLAACGGGGGGGTIAPLPIVTTGSASSGFVDNATLNGTVDPNGLDTDVWFQVSTDNTFATYDNTTIDNVGTTAGAVVHTISGLDNNTTYYYRIVASNSAGTSTGSTLSFATPALNPAPAASAGPDQSVYMRMAGAGSVAVPTVVTLDASGSTDVGGSVASYAWTQLSGTGVTLSDDTAASPTFSAPQFALGAPQELVFEVEVTDNDGLTSTDNVTITVNYGFLDDFSTDTTGYYGVGGAGTLAYGAGVAEITTGDGVNKWMSQSFNFTSGTDNGVFSIDYTPTDEYGAGGGVEISLGVTANTKYFISTNTGVVEKWSGGVPIAGQSVSFTPACTLGSTHTITITFDHNDTSATICGTTVPLPHDTTETSIAMEYFTVNVVNQDASLDNFKLQMLP